jgi:medium-chain acyl-[acyl-carrier-protein] hydrolase
MNQYGESNFTLRAYEVNPSGEARLASLCDFLQESAGNHANELGFGFDDMLEQNLYWVLTRMSVRVSRYPEYGDTVLVRTWPKGVRGPFALRDFNILDSNGNELLAATSGWLVIDSHTRKPRRPHEILALLHRFSDDHAIEEPPVKVGHNDEFVRHGTIMTRPSDVDLQNHVNSMRYVSWIEDAYTSSIEKSRTAANTARFSRILGIDINFILETRAGEELRWSLGHEQSQQAGPGDGERMDTAWSIAARLERTTDGEQIVRSRLLIESESSAKADPQVEVKKWV